MEGLAGKPGSSNDFIEKELRNKAEQKISSHCEDCTDLPFLCLHCFNTIYHLNNIRAYTLQMK